ncbi:MAG: methyltransferase domain-containing protein [Pseudomonadota bacterium]
MRLKEHYDEGFYRTQKAGSLISAERVLSKLAPVLGDLKSAVDIGCGVGGWLKVLSDCYPGIAVAGVDHPDVPDSELFIDKTDFHGHDLSQSLDLGRRFDIAVTLEVIEHIDEQYADIFVDNLARHSDLILFSAATPRQGGTNHVNEQWPSYWCAKMSARGYKAHDIIRPLIWEDDDIEYWYRQNMLLFAKDGRWENTRRLEDWKARAFVHPDSWMLATHPRPPFSKRLARRITPGWISKVSAKP